MCTVTYLPTANENFILTSNRDESPLRPTSEAPEILSEESLEIICPIDKKAGGTWIAAANNQRAVCLLNGAFTKHTPNPPYKKSRGLIVLNSLVYPSNTSFIENINLTGIEPFTLILVQRIPNLQVRELRWDGNSKHDSTLDATTPKIWSSVNLYPDDILRKRVLWFNDWLAKRRNFDIPGIREFHQIAGDGNNTSNLIMNRENEVRTLSITTMASNRDEFLMIHKDLTTKKESMLSLAYDK